MGYQKFASPRTEQGIHELHIRCDVVSSINTYLQMILWLRLIHILPELCEEAEQNTSLVYPFKFLSEFYSKRRANLQEIHTSIRSTDILLIDGLIKEICIGKIWQEKGGNGIYPPPSIYAALSTYLLIHVPLEQKHALLYYILLDIAYTLPNWQFSLISKIRNVATIINLSESIMKLTEAFWDLDHQDFEGAIKKLFDPCVKSIDILPWQHGRVIRSFLFQGEAFKALKYINHMSPPENDLEDMKLHISVLLACSAVTQAFEYQRKKQDEDCAEELLNHLFLGCQETRKMNILIYLPLNTFETSSLIKFLLQNEDPRAHEALIMYYLLHCNIFEAAKINEKLLSSNLENSFPTKLRTAERTALIESLMAAVPKAEKKLAEELTCIPSETFKFTEVIKMPQPLSIVIKNCSFEEIAYSDLLNSLIFKASHTIQDSFHESQTPLKSRSNSIFEETPFLRPAITPNCTRHTFETSKLNLLTKRNLSSPNLNEFASPSKKSRLLDNAIFKTDSLKKKTPQHLAGDITSLLQTPPIHRQPPRTPKYNENSFTLAQPQSILKKQTNLSLNAEIKYLDVQTPPVLSENNSENEEMMQNEEIPNKMLIETDSPSKQIRFKVPSVLQRPNESNILISSITHPTEPFVQSEPSYLPSNKSTDKALLLMQENIESHSKDNLSEKQSYEMSSNRANIDSSPALYVSTNVSLDEQIKDSSGSSIYSSASERSFHISPRRPLRDTSMSNQGFSLQGTISKVIDSSQNKIIDKEKSIDNEKYHDSLDIIASEEELDKNSLQKKALAILKETERYLTPSFISDEIRTTPAKVRHSYMKSQIKTVDKKKDKNANDQNSTEIKLSSLNQTLKGYSETYEEFSLTFRKDVAKIGSTNEEKIYESSPHNEQAEGNVPLKTTVKNSKISKPSSEKVKSKSSTVQKKQAFSKKNALTRTKKSTLESNSSINSQFSRPKSKGKTKSSKKLEFSFADPISPAEPEILEALASPPDKPVPTFVFSPPTTRARLRKKKLEESLSSSHGSMLSEKSFTQVKKPPIDSLLQDIIFEENPEAKSFFDASSSSSQISQTKKKSTIRKTRHKPSYIATIQDSLTNLISPNQTNEEITTPKTSIATRHSMVLRQTKKQKKSVTLF